jgi:hypothetical protein
MSIKLCPPALVYLVISFIAIFIMFFQNIGSRKIYCLGTSTCNVSDVYIIFIIKILYVLFWTWVLNLICKSGYEPMSWFLVLFPFLLFFIMIAMMVSGIYN